MSSLLNFSSSLLSLSAAKHGWLYIFNEGFLFSGAGLVSQSVRFTASVLLSLTGEPFEVEVAGGALQRGNAFVVRPGVWRSVAAPRTPIVSIGVCPTRDSFRAFSTTTRPGDLWALPREDFDDWEEPFETARSGLLNADAACELSKLIVDKAQQHLPKPPPLDPRIDRVRTLLERNPATSMTRLASEVDLSYHRLSHLFSQQMGITLRMYTIQLKLDSAAMKAGLGMSLTQIAVSSGFADSAHFCRTWIRNVGSPPSQLLNSQYVGLRSTYGAN